MNVTQKIPSEKAVVPPAQNPAPRPRRILLVDDDPHFVEFNAGVLIRSDYDVDTAVDGAAGWKALNESNYDLLITDHKMPKVTGLELIKKVRSEDMTLPVILASGTMPTEELKRHPWLLINAKLSKPFTTGELLNTVENILGPLIQTPFADLMLHPEKLAAALETIKISQAEKPANVPVRARINPSHRILVVDDDKDVRQLSMDVLTGSGYDVEGVQDGAAGWKALQTGSYDLVVTDNKMPNMTGIEMIAKLRSARLAVPVIMATGILPTHEFERQPWLKPDATLQRPFSNDDLLATVKKVLHTDDGNKAHMKMLLSMYL